jgi:uncharacterized protein (DUF885 family)
MNRILLFCLFAFAVSCNQKPSGTKSDELSKNMNKLFEDYYEERLQLYPLEATAIADNRYNDLLPADISDSYRQKLLAFYQKYQNELAGYDRSQVTGQDALSYDILKHETEIQIEGLKFNDNLMPVNQFWSMHLTFAQLGSGSGNQPFKTVKDYEDFLKRINAFVAYEDTAISNMRRGMAEGVTPPKILMERVLPQLEGIYSKKLEENVFYGPIKNMPDSFNAETKTKFKADYTKAINEQINPAYKKLHDFIKDEYMPKCRETAGISSIPNGKEYYAFLAKFWTTTNLTPDEIFNIGHSEVARLKSEMQKVMEEVGYKEDMKSFFNYLHTDKKFMPFKTAAEVLNAYRHIDTVMEPQLKKLFNLVPKTKFEVRETEKFREASSSAEYNQGAPDGSRPGIFYVPVPNPEKFNAVGMEDLFLHEAIPGHHYQISLQQENTDLPRFRRFSWYGAYGEGWALYTESLGKELGLYTDPYQYFGSLSEEMHRAIRLVVDVGMHVKGWTREQAIQFSLENEAESEADITSEIERYMAIPGQALAYKIGQMKIRELRKKAETQLGSKFSIQKFHDEVLKTGCLPMDVFEKEINSWIEEQKKAA